MAPCCPARCAYMPTEPKPSASPAAPPTHWAATVAAGCSRCGMCISSTAHTAPASHRLHHPHAGPPGQRDVAGVAQRKGEHGAVQHSPDTLQTHDHLAMYLPSTSMASCITSQDNPRQLSKAAVCMKGQHLRSRCVAFSISWLLMCQDPAEALASAMESIDSRANNLAVKASLSAKLELVQSTEAHQKPDKVPTKEKQGDLAAGCCKDGQPHQTLRAACSQGANSVACASAGDQHL